MRQSTSNATADNLKLWLRVNHAVSLLESDGVPRSSIGAALIGCGVTLVASNSADEVFAAAKSAVANRRAAA